MNFVIGCPVSRPEESADPKSQQTRKVSRPQKPADPTSALTRLSTCFLRNPQSGTVHAEPMFPVDAFGAVETGMSALAQYTRQSDTVPMIP